MGRNLLGDQVSGASVHHTTARSLTQWGEKSGDVKKEGTREQERGESHCPLHAKKCASPPHVPLQRLERGVNQRSVLSATRYYKRKKCSSRHVI